MSKHDYVSNLVHLTNLLDEIPSHIVCASEVEATGADTDAGDSSEEVLDSGYPDPDVPPEPPTPEEAPVDEDEVDAETKAAS